MNNSKDFQSVHSALQSAAIILLDGRKVPVTLLPVQPSEIVPDDMTLDSTGEYLSIGGKRRCKSRNKAAGKKEEIPESRLFVENVHLILETADKILNDGRLFLAPVPGVNGLAYTGTSGFRHPTIGVYLEWWRNFKEIAFDEDHNPIWLISGSPLTGASACKAVNSNNESVPAKLRVPFNDVWQSFMGLNQVFTEAKQRCEAYTFEEALSELRRQL